MTTIRARWAEFADRPLKERGYVAVMTALMMTLLVGLAAFAVDVGNWYLVGQQEQRAADAAAMAGVSYLPGDPTSAGSTAKSYSKINGFEDGVNFTTVTSTQDGGATRLRVSVDRTITNFFGSLLGVPTTKVSRSSVADFAGPVPLGSPCNRFGNNVDPVVGGVSTDANTCSGVLGGFWANVNSPGARKQDGDPYQGTVCGTASPAPGNVDSCTAGAGPNTDYTSDGYFYTVSVKAPMSKMTIELFDPVFVNQGLTCNDINFGNDDKTDASYPYSTLATNDQVADEPTRYDNGSSSAYCTGDAILPGPSSQVMNTQFTVRSPGTSPWDVTTFPVVNGCQKQYPGYDGSIYWLLDQVRSSDAGGGPNPKYNKDSTGTVGPAGQTMVDGFRRWVTLCTIDNPPVGDYLVQVKTNGLTTTKAGVTTSMDAANASNHFAIRAYNPTVGAPAVDKENLAIAGREKMGIYANKPGVTTEFHLARVPSTAKGQTLKVRLFDVGDSAAGGSTGTINVVRPPDATGDAFGLAASPCVGTLSTNASVNLTSCSLTGVQSSTHNGKWQSINVPIPANYACTDSDSTKCWVRLQYVYGSSTSPNDVTAWTATIEGDPVRLVE